MKQLIDKLIGNIEWVLTAFFILILPVVYSKISMDPVLYPRYFALSIWVLVISIILIIKTYRGKFEFYFSPSDKVIFVAAFLFVLINALSAFGAINMPEAIYKTFKEFTLMLTFFYFFQMLRNNEKGMDIAIKSVIAMAGIFVAIGYYQLADSDFTKFKQATGDYAYWFRQAIFDVKSTLASPLPFATILFLSLPFITYGLIAFKKIWRLFSFLVLGSSLFFIIILTSKGAWGALGLAALVGLILIFIYFFQIMPKKLGKELPIFAKVGILLMPFVIFFATLFLVEKTELKIVKVIVEKVGQVLSPEKSLNAMYNVDKPSTTQTRTLVWANTIQMARDNPYLGVGPGQWRIVYAKYGIDAFASDIRNGGKHFQRPHNDFLWILGEVGFTGLFLYVFIFIFVLVKAFKNFKSTHNLKLQLFNGIAFSFLIGFIIILNVDFPRERISHNVVYLLLFAIVLSFNNDAEKKTDFKLKKTLALSLLILFMGLSLFNLRLASDMVKGDRAARDIKIALFQNNMPQLARAVRFIEGSYYTLDPFAVPIPYYKATVLYKQGKIEEAKKEYLIAHELHPYHIMVLSNLGTSYDLTGDKVNAIKYYQQALDISPRFKEVLVNMAIVLYNQNKLDEALDYISKVPYGEKNPPNFEKSLITICRKKAIQLANDCNPKKLNDWFYDENKVKGTFVRFQKEKVTFGKILLQEIGK